MRDGLGSVDTGLLIGGSSDIGLAILDRIKPKKQTILMGRDLERMQSAAKHLTMTSSGEVETVEWDAQSPADDADVFEAIFRGRDIDIAIIAVGALGDGTHLLEDPRAAVEMAQATYLGPMRALLNCARLMARQGHGEIVVLSSFAVARPRPSNFVYGSAKAGLDYLARGLADYSRRRGVRIIIVRPGFVHTRMTAHLSPAPMSVTPEEVAAAVQDARNRNRQVSYVPRRLALLAGALKVLPRGLVERLDER